MKDRKQDYAELEFRQADDLVHQRQRFSRRAKKASELINYLLARKGYAQTQSKTDLTEAWQTAVGNEWKNKTMIGNIRRGVLEVIVANSAAIQQLNFNKHNLLASLQNQLPQNNIRDIKFRIGIIN